MSEEKEKTFEEQIAKRRETEARRWLSSLKTFECPNCRQKTLWESLCVDCEKEVENGK